MRFEETSISGVLLVLPVPAEDERGLFARTFDRDAFLARGLADEFPQQSTAFNARAGTIRGLHYQISPYAENKLVRCTAGRLWDVALDLRHRSATFGKTFAVELSAANRLALYIPAGCAHGYQTLEDETEALYLISQSYTPGAARGVRYDDPSLGIAWPMPVSAISDRDRAFSWLAKAELP